MHLFEVSDEAKKQKLRGEYEDDYDEESFGADDREKCGGCNWEVTNLYVLASSQEEADELYVSGEAGLCGDCMGELLVEGVYEIAGRVE